MGFTVEYIDLRSKTAWTNWKKTDPHYDEYHTTSHLNKAAIYKMSGVTVSDEKGNVTERPLSITELIMAICLRRSAALEDNVVSLMAAMQDNTDTLEDLTAIEEKLIAGQTLSAEEKDKLKDLGIDTSKSGDDLIVEIENKMDQLNSFSQQKLIELQSNTNKLDQSFDLLSNAVKAIHQVEMGAVNNI